MSGEVLVQHCSPTLAGIKTGNMFTCKFADKSELRDWLCWCNRIFTRKGLRVLPLRFKNDRALIYTYRPTRLSADLKNDMALEILKERGYEADIPEHCITELIRRLREYNEFPHEVGLFLGYPPEDVKGFIEKRAADCKCVGCWKVYGDMDTAQRLFAQYKKCTDVYCKLFAKGKTIEQLIVTV